MSIHTGLKSPENLGVCRITQDKKWGNYYLLQMTITRTVMETPWTSVTSTFYPTSLDNSNPMQIGIKEQD